MVECDTDCYDAGDECINLNVKFPVLSASLCVVEDVVYEKCMNSIKTYRYFLLQPGILCVKKQTIIEFFAAIRLDEVDLVG